MSFTTNYSTNNTYLDLTPFSCSLTFISFQKFKITGPVLGPRFLGMRNKPTPTTDTTVV